MGGGESKGGNGGEKEKQKHDTLLQQYQKLSKHLVGDLIDISELSVYLQASSQKLKHDLSFSAQKAKQGLSEEISYLEKCGLAASTLSAATEDLQSYKKRSIETLREFIRLITKSAEKEGFETGCFGENLLEIYLKGTQTQISEDNGNADCPDRSNLNKTGTSKAKLMKIIKKLRKENAELNARINRCEELEDNFRKEKEILTEIIQRRPVQFDNDFDDPDVGHEETGSNFVHVSLLERNDEDGNQMLTNVKCEYKRTCEKETQCQLDTTLLNAERRLSDEVAETLTKLMSDLRQQGFHDKFVPSSTSSAHLVCKSGHGTDSSVQLKNISEMSLQLTVNHTRMCQEIEALNDTIHAQNKENSRLNAHFKTLFEDNATLEEHIVYHKIESKKRKEEITRLGESIYNMQLNLDRKDLNFKQKTSDLEKTIAELEQKLAKCEEVKEEVKEKNTNLEKDLRQHASKLETKEEQEVSFLKIIDQNKEEIGRLMSQSIVLEKEKADIISKLIENESHLKELIESKETQLKKYKDKIKKLKEENIDVNANKKALIEENNLLKQTITELQKQNQERINECQQNVEQYEQTQTKLIKQEEEHKAILEQKEAEKVCLYKQMSFTNERITKLETKIKMKKDKLKNLEKDMKDSRETLIEKETRFKKATKRFEEQIDKLQKEKSDVETEREDILTRSNSHEKRVLEQTSQLEELANKTEVLSKTLSQIKKDNARYQMRIKELDFGKAELEKKCIIYQTEIKTKEEKINSLSQTIQNANETSSEKESTFEREKAELMSMVDRANHKKIELEQKVKDETQRNRNLGKQVNELTQNGRELEKQLNDYKDKLRREKMDYEGLKLRLEEKTQECSNLLNEKDDENKLHENKVKLLLNDKEKLDRKRDQLSKDLAQEMNALKDMKKRNEDLINDKQSLKDEIIKTEKETRLKLLEKRNEIQAHATEKSLISKENSMLQEKLQKADVAIKSLNEEICKVKRICNASEKNVIESTKHLTRVEQDKKELEERQERLTEDVRKLTAENEAIKHELDRIKSRKIVQIQLYSQSGVGLLSSVEDELKSVLKSKVYVEEDVDVDILNCAKASDIQPDIPLLILCIQASRLGTAVASTVQGLTLTSKMAVLIFHHKDEHALPNQASERVLTGQELRRLGGIFDLAFLSEKGIYECKMNRDNFVSLMNFIKREGTRKYRDDI